MRYQQNYEQFEDDEGDDAVEMFSAAGDEEEEFLEAAGQQLVSQEMNRQIMSLAVELCSQSWLWRFYSLDTKLAMVGLAYERLNAAI